MAAPLRVLNKGESTFVDCYDGETFVVEPGEEALVPPDAVSLWFGDPSSTNEDLNRARDIELDRLKVRYGQYVAELEASSNGTPPAVWEDRHPQFEVRTMTDEVVATVLSDPQGKSIHDAKQSISDQESLLELIKSQSEDLAKLKAEFAAREREREALAEGKATVDTPKQVASKRSRNQELRVDVPVELPEDAPA